MTMDVDRWTIAHSFKGRLFFKGIVFKATLM